MFVEKISLRKNALNALNARVVFKFVLSDSNHMVNVYHSANHMPYKSWRRLAFSVSVILLKTIDVRHVPKQSCIVGNLFVEICSIVIECRKMEIVGFTRNLLIKNLIILCVFESILCQRSFPENQVFNNRQWSIGPSARCKCILFRVRYLQYRTANKEVWNFSKVLSLFTVYQWTTGLCVAASGEYGNCVSENECLSKSGILGGPCAEGFGICCICKHRAIQFMVPG